MTVQNLTHWRQTQHPDYLGAWALQPGEEPVITIASAGVEKVIGSDGKREECLVITYKEKIGPGKMIVNATNSRTIEKLSGSPYIQQWPGTRLQVYVEKVKAFGDVVDALRIRPFKPKETAPVPNCSDCGGQIVAAYGKTPAQLAQYTQKQYNAPLCASCAEKRAASAQAEPEGEGKAE